MMIIIGILIGITATLATIFAISLKRGKKVSINTYAKAIVSVTIIHGMILTTLSYILAYNGMDPVVDVSTTIVREIVAPVLTYLATNTIMNIFEKNKLWFSVPISSTIIDAQGKAHTYAGASDTFLGEPDETADG